MNILFITQLFPSDKYINNTSEALREIVIEWAKEGHRVKVIRPYYSYEKEPFPKNPQFEIEGGISVEFVKPVRIPLLKFGYYSNRKIAGNLNFKPDRVICHMYNSYFTFHRLAKIFNVPLVIGIHFSDIRIAKNFFHRIHQELIFRKASAFACRSKNIENLFHKYFPSHKKKTFLALSGLPKIYFSQKKEWIKKETVRIITVSWLIKRKQIDRVIKALEKMPATLSWEYVIIGTGQEEEPLRQLASGTACSERIHFLGKKSREAVIAELIQSDIFVLPSYNETLGLVYLEAMACGCLTIGSEKEGIDGIIQDGKNGLLCNPYSDDSVFEKLNEAINMREERFKEIVSGGLKTVSGYSNEQKSREYMEHLIKLAV